MKKAMLFVLAAMLLQPVLAWAQSGAGEEEAVKTVIVNGYIKGIYLLGDTGMIRSNWHEDCDIVYLDPQSRTLLKAPAAKYFIDHFTKQPGPLNEHISYDFTEIRVTGYAAVATVEIFNEDRSRHIYTDYLNLYKFPDGWRIVSKTFYAYPRG